MVITAPQSVHVFHLEFVVGVSTWTILQEYFTQKHKSSVIIYSPTSHSEQRSILTKSELNNPYNESLKTEIGHILFMEESHTRLKSKRWQNLWVNNPFTAQA